MNARRLCLIGLATLPLLVAAAGDEVAPALDKERKAQEKAARRKAHEDALEALRRGEILPLARILEIAAEHLPGETIEVEFKGGPVYEVKVLTADGRIREIVLDARSGAFLRFKDD